MSWLDDLFGGSSTSNPPPPPPPPPAPTQTVPSYGDFLNNYVNMAAANEKAAPPKNMFAWLSGSGHDAAVAQAQTEAPGAYLDLLSKQTGAQQGQLTLGQLVQGMRGMGFNPDAMMPGSNGPGQPGAASAPQNGPTPPPQANVSPGGMPASAPPGSPPGQPMAAPGVPMPQSAGPAAPALTGGAPGPAQAGPVPNGPLSGAPGVQPGGPGMPAPQAGGPAASPMNARLGTFINAFGGMPSFMPQVLEAMKQQQVGLDGTNTVRNGSGIVVDPITQRPITTDVGTLMAGRAGKTSAAQAAGQMPYINAEKQFAGNVDVATHAANVKTDTANDLVTGFDKTTGQPVSTSRMAALQNPNFVSGTNPYFADQQKELDTLRTNAASADKGLDLAVNTANVAKGLYTGTGAPQLQDLRKAAIGLGALTGVQPSQTILNDTSGFEQLKFNAQQLIAIEAHNFTARVTNNMVNLVNQAKPGDERSMQGIHDIITKQLMPAMMREQDIGAKTAQYYTQNPTKNDAAWVVPSQLPLENYSVNSDLSKVSPGGYYIDPASGNIRQRPAQ